MLSFKPKTAFKRIAILFLTIFVGIFISIFVPVKTLIDTNFLIIILTIFPVLFGFCLTIITVCGNLDAAMSVIKWEDLALYQAAFKNRLIRLMALAILYAFVILLGLILRLNFFASSCLAHTLLARSMLACSLIALFYSFFMPYWLYTIYCERYEILSKSKGASEV